MRGSRITTNRLFLSPNPLWKDASLVGWYKNCPIWKNQISKWTTSAAEQIGIDTERAKITNHSLRSTAVSHLAREGVGEGQLIRITGHSSTASIMPYLQLDKGHHAKMVEKMRHDTPSETPSTSSSTTISNIQNTLRTFDEDRKAEEESPKIINFHNCNFYNNQF